MHLDANVSDHIKVNNSVFNCVRYVLLLPALWADRKRKYAFFPCCNLLTLLQGSNINFYCMKVKNVIIKCTLRPDHKQLLITSDSNSLQASAKAVC